MNYEQTIEAYKDRMKELKLNARQVAEMTGYSQSGIYAMLNYERSPGIHMILEVGETLGFDLHFEERQNRPLQDIILDLYNHREIAKMKCDSIAIIRRIESELKVLASMYSVTTQFGENNLKKMLKEIGG